MRGCQKAGDERISPGPSTALNVPGNNFPTVLERTQQRGMKVGDVSTAEITDATPAVPSSHIRAIGVALDYRHLRFRWRRQHPGSLDLLGTNDHTDLFHVLGG
ncbi:alkaline phosphatase [Actinocrispum sp. NPDC049592]|uniref:alkaline phosphatase n=1 Tax=Actinocrispum sp. NPDC049592 TaxID=3154835 RepID=UPI003421A17F